MLPMPGAEASSRKHCIPCFRDRLQTVQPGAIPSRQVRQLAQVKEVRSTEAVAGVIEEGEHLVHTVQTFGWDVGILGHAGHDDMLLVRRHARS
jgi:hypothetical protein